MKKNFTFELKIYFVKQIFTFEIKQKVSKEKLNYENLPKYFFSFERKKMNISKKNFLKVHP